MYAVGKTGTGKSTLLRVLIEQDIRNGEGLAVLDPHGDVIEAVLATFPEKRRSDVIHFDVPNPACAIAFNPFDGVPEEKRPLAGAALVEVFKKIWTDSWGVRLEHILRNSLLTLLDQPEATLADILRLLVDDPFRRTAVARTRNAQVRQFWASEYERYSPRYRVDVAAPIQNKIGAFLSDPILHRILTTPRSSFSLREVMDSRKVLLVNLAKGRIGESSSALLGSMIVSQIGSAGLSRADVGEHTRSDFYVYLDEFQTFTTQSLSGMLSELRKYRVNMILANQYLSQVDEQVAESIMGNVGTLVTFRVGPKDAVLLAKEFAPVFLAADLVNIPNHSVYLKLMIDGSVSRPFSADTICDNAWNDVVLS